MTRAYIANKDYSDLDQFWMIRVNSHMHLRIYVWESTVGLYRNTKFRKKSGKNTHLGAYIGYPHPRKTGLFGEIHLLREMIGAGYVSHEIQHFINDYACYFGLSLFKSNEKIAYLTSDTVNAFWIEFYERYDVVPTGNQQIKEK